MDLAVLFSSLALLAAAPSQITLAQADTAPPTSEAPVATTNATADKEAAGAALAKGESPFPSGAPTDDYGFMAWCYGALSGHVDLYDQVMPEVKRIEAEFPDTDRPIDKVMQDYADQHSLGQKILDGYAHVLNVEEQTGKTGGKKRTPAVAKGKLLWKGSDKADARQLAQLWMSWALPARCESTAARLAPTASAQ
jgi:hypothetical protein